jgi:integrase
MDSVNPSGKHRKQRRRRGEGSVPFVRRDHPRLKPYVSVLSLGVDPLTGKRIRKSFSGATPEAAARARDDACRLLNLRLHPDALTMTVGAMLDRYLDSVRPPATRPTTYSRYRAAVDRHLRPALGSGKLLELDQAAIRRAMPSWGAAHSQAYALGRLRAALEHAASERLVERNEAEHIRKPRFVTREAPTITPTDAARILAAFVGHRLYALAVLALGCGLRRGELLGLRWEDVDLDAATLTVRLSLRYVPPEFRSRIELDAEQNTRLMPPKTKSGHRILPLPPIAVSALKAVSTRQGAERRAAKVWSENDFVFADVEGRSMWPATATYQVEHVLKSAGFPGMRLHDLRAGYATIVAAEGIHPRVAQGLMGHATMRQSMDYTKVVPADAREAASRVDRALRRTS